MIYNSPMAQRIKFRTLTQDEFDARHPAVPEPDGKGPRFTGEVNVPSIGWVPASIHRGVPDMYFHDDVWVMFPRGSEFTKVT
jgi:hypothetical protein